MVDRLSEQAASIGALAEPVRRDLYAFVVAQPDAVGREQAAEGVGIPLHMAKFHLDRLVADGLLEVEFRRLSGRTGPGAGRPAKLYRRSARELSVSLPERRYELAGEILAEAVDTARGGDVELGEAVARAAAERGRRAVAGSEVSGPDLDRVGTVLRDHGYEPTPREGALALGNCPFDALAREHTALVCGLNERFVSGVIEGLDCPRLAAVLDPEQGLCCVKVRPVGD